MKVAEITVSNTTTVGGNSGMIQQSTVDELQNIGGVIDVAGELSYSESSSSQPSMSQGGSGNPNGGDMTNSILGIEASKLSLAGIDELNGTAFEDNSKEAIIGSQYAMMNNLSIGDNITIHNTEFEITGIYETGSMFADSTIYVPIDTLQNISECDEYTSVLVKTAEDANDTIISDKIKDKFYDLSTLTSDEISSMMTNVTGILNTASLAVSGLAIIVGAIGIINTMVMTVYERTKEIGVLKSIGWKPRRILLMIMGETLVLTILSQLMILILPSSVYGRNFGLNNTLRYCWISIWNFNFRNWSDVARCW